jgi:nicotinamide riboside kinase
MEVIHNKLKKIVILGPESTGKSTLCQMLATHYHTVWCPEYAREYLYTNGTAYTYDDLLTIAKGQLALEEEYEGQPPSIPPKGGSTLRKIFPVASQDSVSSDSPSSVSGLPTPDSGLKASGLLFIDTDQYVMKVWCEYVFGDCHNWILRRIAERPYDGYLLCKPDLPWVQDALREYPDEKPRQELFHMYRDILIQQSTPWAEISGTYEERFERAKKAAEEWVR